MGAPRAGGLRHRWAVGVVLAEVNYRAFAQRGRVNVFLSLMVTVEDFSKMAVVDSSRSVLNM
ncbi:hypothetical protein C798_12285 [Herbaspirillum rubrisubalbicans Os34]|uniref:Uncharacterized protein n=1 Tax=Herbaspirillum rubrisubalbicans Os34 TaxID=1235827 RepID=A0A6M3ZQT7_9BURK|nr:hypothetical protein C798_12285 [Herbaspirillum rubrisubalbicans Os34]